MPKYLFSPNKKLIILEKLYQIFESILSPKFCLNCLQKSNYYLCLKCLDEFNFRLNYFCFKCERRIFKTTCYPHHCQLIKFLISFNDYENNSLRKIIIEGKKNASEIFSDFGYLMGNFIKKQESELYKNLKNNNYFLTPVPTTKKKLLERGFNQTEILAERISAITEIPIFNGLEKIKDTKDQAELDYQQRLINLKEAFNLKTKPPKNVILIDDIKTTGATLKECAQTLKKGGTKNIIALTILK